MDGENDYRGAKNVPPDVLVPNFSLRYSGVTATLERAVRFQRNRMATIAIVGIHRDKSLPYLPSWRWYELWRRPKHKMFRIWHARRNSEMFCGLLLRDVLRMPIRLVFTSAAQRKHTRYTRHLISKMDAIIATSPESASYLDRPARIIPHGIDFEEFFPAKNRALLRATLEFPDKLLIGCFGRIRPQKGTDLFIDAMIEIAKRHINTYAIISGLTKPEHEGFARELRQKIAKSGFTDRFLWVGEQLPEKMPGLFRAIDIYVAPQRWEGHGITPLEAMASSVPVVATKVGAFPDQIVDGLTGLLVLPRDRGQLVRAIDKLISDPSLRKSMGGAGRARVMANFSIAREADQISEVYENLWESSPANAIVDSYV
jgi:mannosyltransferase